ncbi:hypothetical protein PGN83_15215 [Klebsiella aerogenes]|uniref:hypothetical protein n=1 Tax=Klebsiella aerogenes TaxID=548 RepID=UPI001BD21E58|nr:hypothetical protein [Klebsiella aerogenes]EKW1037836.1 hypothetical protein [Klebsiella aerogenes]
MSATESGLHRTRLRVLDHNNFSVLFFYKQHCRTAPWLAVCGKLVTEKIEKNFSFFSEKDL